MKARRSRAPPPSSHSYSEINSVINVDELASHISPYYAYKTSQASPCSSSQLPSYISLLPPEVLLEIFAYCIPQEQFPIPSCTEAPLLLTHISSHWRALAISLPDLWTALHINYKDPTEDISITNAYLARSGDRPLALSIAIDFAEQPQQQIIDTLCKQSMRWKHIRFDFRHLMCPPIYSLDQALENVPQLTTFEFHARDISNINVTPITRLLSSAPVLREISWVDDLADINTLLNLPLYRLTRLSLSIDHGTLDYIRVLKECSNVEHIQIVRSLSPIIQPQDPLSLSKLTSLNISSNIIGILDCLVLPALREVRIHLDHHKHETTHDHPLLPHALPQPHAYAQPSTHLLPSPTVIESWDATALLSLVDRSACAITSLHVNPPMTEHTILMCLRRMSHSLVKLWIEGVVFGDTLLEALTCRRNTEGKKLGGAITEVGLGCSEIEDFLCPKLEEIYLDARVGSTQGVLASMVESRVLLVHPSNSHSVDGSDSIDLSVEQLYEGPVSPFRKIKVTDGHKDIERLKEISLLSKSWTSAATNARRPVLKRASTEGEYKPGASVMQAQGLTVDVIPRKPNARTRSFFFRRKLCASR